MRIEMTINKIKKAWVIIRDRYFLNALLKKSAAATEHLQLLKTLECKTVVDIGANRGQFALVARKCFPQAIIHSVEPLDEPLKIFRSVFNNDNKVILHQCAIGSKNEISTIHISKQDDSSSLLPIGDTQVQLFPDTQEIETHEVLVRTLDELLDGDLLHEPSLLKLDVQGYELETLKGCSKLLEYFSYIYVEASFIELYKGQSLAYQVINFLADKRFNLSGVYNVYYDSKGKAVQVDFFFDNQKCSSQS